MIHGLLQALGQQKAPLEGKLWQVLGVREIASLVRVDR